MGYTTTETLTQTVKGLAVLAAIPVVLFALWADYFGRYLANARKTAPNFDPKIERERVRVAGACVLLFELILTIGALGTLQHYPTGAAAGLLFCLLAVGYIQAGLEKQLTPVNLAPARPGQVAGASEGIKTAANGWRALALAVMSGVLYVVTLVAFVKVAVWIATALHFHAAWMAVFVMTAAAAGILSGLTLNFALAPWQMRHSLPVAPMTPEQVAAITGPLEKVGLKDAAFWIVEDRHATAAIAGFRGGRGVFRPALFVSRSVMTSLASEEIRAAVAHEAAHTLARHLRRRVLLSAGLIICLTFMAVFLSLAAFTYFPKSGLQGSFGMIFGVTAFALAFFILQKQNRIHEFEADWIAIHKLGADFDSWANALRKMDQLNGFSTRGGTFSTHPRTEIRIQNVAKMLEYFAASAKAPAAESESRKDRAA